MPCYSKTRMLWSTERDAESYQAQGHATSSSQALYAEAPARTKGRRSRILDGCLAHSVCIQRGLLMAMVRRFSPNSSRDITGNRGRVPWNTRSASISARLSSSGWAQTGIPSSCPPQAFEMAVRSIAGVKCHLVRPTGSREYASTNSTGLFRISIVAIT